jgi:hypothetical protein
MPMSGESGYCMFGYKYEGLATGSGFSGDGAVAGVKPAPKMAMSEAGGVGARDGLWNIAEAPCGEVRCCSHGLGRADSTDCEGGSSCRQRRHAVVP